MMNVADMDDAPFRDIPSRRIPYRLTNRGAGMIHVHETWDVLESLQRELDEFAANRGNTLDTVLLHSVTYLSHGEVDRYHPHFVCCAGCGAELTISDWETLPEAPIVRHEGVRVCECGAWVEVISHRHEVDHAR